MSNKSVPGRFESLLLPLDGSAESAKGMPCALWLAEKLGATLHVMHVTLQAASADNLLEELGIPAARRSEIVVHQTVGEVTTEIISAVEKHRVGMLIMSARGQSYFGSAQSERRLGSTARNIIEHCRIPVLLLPLHYREVLPWRSMLVAASGETAADQALETAVQLAAALGIKVTVVHSDAGTTARYVDMAPYEYSQRIEEMVERGLSGCVAEECLQVEQALLRYGDPAEVLVKQIRNDVSSVLALGWHGSFGAGRAHVLKLLLKKAECALLIVKGPVEERAVLQVEEKLNS